MPSRPKPGQLRQSCADWRVERLVPLMGDDWLAGEWDPARQLVLPQPGGKLTRVLRCAVPGCENDGYTSTKLCTRHRHQFSASGLPDLEPWLSSGEPAPYKRRRGVDRACIVSGADGRGCPRPADGRWQLCGTHSFTWWKYRRKGIAFEDFLARAVPLAELGDCAAACCWRRAASPQNRLCSLHVQLWRAEGGPAGRAFASWAARVRQPEDSSRPQPAGSARARALGTGLRHRLPGRRPGGVDHRQHAALGRPTAGRRRRLA